MDTVTAQASTTRRRRPWYTVLYIQVLIAIAIGVLVGNYYPDLGKAMKRRIEKPEKYAMVPSTSRTKIALVA